MEGQKVATGQVNPASQEVHHAYVNDELEGRGSRAGEVYRIMREKLVAIHVFYKNNHVSYLSFSQKNYKQ